MSEKINVQCYKCQTVYELEPEMAGELVECAVCNAAFMIPDLTSGKEVELLHTHPYLPNGNEPSSDEEAEETNLQTAMDMNNSMENTSTTKLTSDTIKITKNTRGMVPKVEDDKFGVCTATNPLHHKPKDNALDDLKKATPKAAKPPPEAKEQEEEDSTGEKEQKKASRWWPFGRKKK